MSSLQGMGTVVVSGLNGSEKFLWHGFCRNLILLKTPSDQLETLFSLKCCSVGVGAFLSLF